MTRRLERNLALLFLGEGSAKAIAMVVFFFLGSTLGPARYGDLEFAVGVWFVLNLILESGLAQFGAREASRDPHKIPALIGQITILRVMVLALDLALLGTFVALIDRSNAAEGLVLLYGLVLIPSTALLGWVFQARNEMGIVAISNLIRQIVLAAGVFCIIRGPADVRWVPILDAGAVLLIVALQWTTLLRRGGRGTWPRASAELTAIVKSAAPMALSSLVWALRLFLPLLALHSLVGSDATGYFGAGHRMVVAGHTFVWLYFFNLLPTLSVLAREKSPLGWNHLLSRSMSIVCRYFIPLVLALSLIAPRLIVLFYGEPFASGGRAFSISILLLGAAAISGHFRYGLIARDKQGLECVANALGLGVVAASLVFMRSSLTIETAAVAFVAGEVTTLAFAGIALLRTEEHRRWATGGLTWLIMTTLVAVATHLSIPESPFLGTIPLITLVILSLLRRDCPLRGGDFMDGGSRFGVIVKQSPTESPYEPD